MASTDCPRLAIETPGIATGGCGKKGVQRRTDRGAATTADVIRAKRFD